MRRKTDDTGTATDTLRLTKAANIDENNYSIGSQ